MMLVGSIFLSAILSGITATDIPIAIPPPFNPRHVGFRRAQFGMFKPGPAIHLGPRLARRLPPQRTNIWLKKFDPRTGSWIKVLKKRPNSKLRHHFAKKAHFSRKAKINKMMMLQKLSRMNIARGRVFPNKGRGRKYKKYSKKLTGMIKIRPVIQTGIIGRSHTPLDSLHFTRRRIIPRRNDFDERFHKDNDFLDDLNVVDDRSFRRIHNTFDGRFNAGFRNGRQPNLGSIGADVGVPRFDVTMQNVPHRGNPSIRRNIAGLKQKDYYPLQNNIPMHDTETVRLDDTQARMLNPENKIKSSVNSAIRGSFDRKNEGSFEEVDDLTSVSFRGMHRDDTSHLNDIGNFGDAGIIGQQTGFIANFDDDLTDKMTETPILDDRILDTPIVSNPVTDIDLKSSGTAGFTTDNSLPDGLLHDFDVVENLDGLGDKNDNIADHLDDHKDRLQIDGPFDDNIEFDARSNDGLDDFDDRLLNTVSQITDMHRGIQNDFLQVPHIAKANDQFFQDDKEFEQDFNHPRHDDRHVGQDDSPIDGLELLGSSRWSDIISELTNAASHNQIFDQVPQKSIPVFPINPHTSVRPSFSVQHSVIGNGNDDMGLGTLALLGIDPRNVATEEMGHQPFKVPETFETVNKRKSINSVAESVVITKNDDSVVTVVTKQPIKVNKGTESSISGSHGPSPTLDISKAAKQLAMFDSLDNLDFGNDSFDEDLKL